MSIPPPISPDLLRAILFVPTWLEPLIGTVTEFALAANPKRLAAFLATVSHESNGGRRLVENLDYSAGRLAAVWPRRFQGADKLPNAAAKLLAHDPEAIANVVYADRMGNGDPASGDGWAFRGRGPGMLTGRDNYLATGRALGLDLVANPDLLLDPTVGARAIGLFWTTRGCNVPADAGDMAGVTRLFNGGAIGLAERTQLYLLACAQLTPTP